MKLQSRILLPVRAFAATVVLAGAALIALLFIRASGQQAFNSNLLVYPELWVLVFLALSAWFTLFSVQAQIDNLLHRLRLLPIDLRKISRGEASPDLGVPCDEFDKVAGRLYRFAKAVRGVNNAKAEMERMAQTDPLTGLPNRRGLLNFINKVIGHRRGWIDPMHVGFMHLDLDHFKTINDTLGHDAGDFVLREAARRMEATIRETDLLARLGGDEFVIVMPGIESEDILARLAQRLIEQFKAPINYDDKVCRVGLSIGMALGPNRENLDDPQRLLSNADLALTHAKTNGRGRFAIFNQSIAEAYKTEKDLAAQIRNGLLESEFVPWFQPVVTLDTLSPVAFALKYKWSHPERGLLTSQDFLPVSEVHNMAIEVGLQILESACLHMREWHANGKLLPHLHFELTRSQIIAPGVVDKISWILDDANIDISNIAVVISEQSCEGRSTELVYANLSRFRELGASVILSDFGKENASLRKLGDACATGVKIDCDLLCTNESRPKSSPRQNVFTRLPAICASLDIDVIATGVDADISKSTVQSLGFRLGQGDRLASPLTPADAAMLLKDANVSAA